MITNTRVAASSDLIDRILQLIYDCGPTATRHDQALVAIEACIAEGVNTKPHIIGVLRGVGFKAGHVASVLDPKRGPFANAAHWRIDGEGRYSLHEDEAAFVA
jgi:uncharacterized protein YhbP (UPF0306 family)